MFNFYFIVKFAGCAMSSDIDDLRVNFNKKETMSEKRESKSKSKNKSKSKKKKENQSSDEIKIVQYRGIRSLFAIRAARRSALKGQKIPLLNIVYTTAFLQVFIVICITTIISLRQETEYFFLNTNKHLREYSVLMMMQIPIYYEQVISSTHYMINFLIFLI